MLQLVHAVQSETLQCTGQGCSLHESLSLELEPLELEKWFCVNAGQAFPPNATSVVMLRKRIFLPPPHCLEQVTLLHADTAQSTGQAATLHAEVWFRAGQSEPLNWGGIVTERLRVCEPLPQLRVQSVQFDQPDTLQWMGHVTLVLHGKVSVRGGQ